MNDISRKLFAKADRAIDSARRELKLENADFAASHAYYAMFYTAEALLNDRGCSKRSGSTEFQKGRFLLLSKCVHIIRTGAQQALYVFGGAVPESNPDDLGWRA